MSRRKHNRCFNIIEFFQCFWAHCFVKTAGHTQVISIWNLSNIYCAFLCFMLCVVYILTLLYVSCWIKYSITGWIISYSFQEILISNHWDHCVFTSRLIYLFSHLLRVGEQLSKQCDWCYITSIWCHILTSRCCCKSSVLEMNRVEKSGVQRRSSNGQELKRTVK